MSADLFGIDAAPAQASPASRWYVASYRVSLVRDGSVSDAGPRPKVRTPEESARVLFEAVPDDGREHFGVMLLDTRHNLIGLHEVSVGCLTSSLVHPRETFLPAILALAAGVILYHNHPSGDPEPSADDLSLTRRLVAGGSLLGIEVFDHIIVCPHAGRFVSLKQRGAI